jgi:predicted TIM-barrel fold metal-dependent hydrolase
MGGTQQRVAMFASIFNMAVIHGRPIFDTMAAPMCHGLFARFPDLRIATIETGCHWVGHFLQEIGSVYGKRQEGFMEPPIETFRRQVWVSPFFEDNFNDLRDLIGADRILFGSDWPHAEGLDQPADYLKEISTTSTMLRRPRFWVAMRAT